MKLYVLYNRTSNYPVYVARKLPDIKRRAKELSVPARAEHYVILHNMPSGAQTIVDTLNTILTHPDQTAAMLGERMEQYDLTARGALTPQ